MYVHQDKVRMPQLRWHHSVWSQDKSLQCSVWILSSQTRQGLKLKPQGVLFCVSALLAAQNHSAPLHTTHHHTLSLALLPWCTPASTLRCLSPPNFPNLPVPQSSTALPGPGRSPGTEELEKCESSGATLEAEQADQKVKTGKLNKRTEIQGPSADGTTPEHTAHDTAQPAERHLQPWRSQTLASFVWAVMRSKRAP